MNKIRFSGLNGLRAISIMLVICNHLGMVSAIFQPAQQHTAAYPFVHFLQDGHLGVNIFFVISGFLITALMLAEQQLYNHVSIKKFYARRLLRIFPAYYFLLLVYGLLQWSGYLYIDGPSWLTAVTYTKYFNWQLGWYTSHAWSLSIEEHFYLFWPLLFTILPRHSVKILWLLVIAVPFVRLFTAFHPVSWISDLSIFTRIDAIATGCLLAFYREKCITLLQKRGTLLFLLSVTALIILSNLPLTVLEQPVTLFTAFGTSHGTFANILISVILVYTISVKNGPWAWLMNCRVLNFTGVISYSLYLWQQFFISPYNKWVNGFPQNIILAFAAATASYYLIEKPFLRLKERFR